MKIDLQIHSVYSSLALYYKRSLLKTHNYLLDSTLQIDKIFNRSEELGLDAISITDHGLTYADKYVRRNINSSVIHIPGAEFRTNIGEILIYGEIEGLKLVGADYFELTEEARSRKCYIAAPHPFLRNPFGYNGLYCPENRGAGLEFNKVFSMVDAICCYWWKDGLDQKSIDLARQFKVKNIATTDAHAYSQIGCGYSEIEDGAKDAEEIIGILKAGKITNLYGVKTPTSSIFELSSAQLTSWFQSYKEIEFLREQKIDPNIVK